MTFNSVRFVTLYAAFFLVGSFASTSEAFVRRSSLRKQRFKIAKSKWAKGGPLGAPVHKGKSMEMVRRVDCPIDFEIVFALDVSTNDGRSDDWTRWIASEFERVFDVLRDRVSEPLVGMTLFSDKSRDPFGTWGDFCSRIEVQLDRMDGFLNTVKHYVKLDQLLANGGDAKENVLGAIRRALLGGLNWSTGPVGIHGNFARRLIVVLTDADTHDGDALRGETPPTKEAVKSDINTACEVADYPSIDNVVNAFNEHNVPDIGLYPNSPVILLQHRSTEDLRQVVAHYQMLAQGTGGYVRTVKEDLSDMAEVLLKVIQDAANVACIALEFPDPVPAERNTTTTSTTTIETTTTTTTTTMTTTTTTTTTTTRTLTTTTTTPATTTCTTTTSTTTTSSSSETASTAEEYTTPVSIFTESVYTDFPRPTTEIADAEFRITSSFSVRTADGESPDARSEDGGIASQDEENGKDTEDDSTVFTSPEAEEEAYTTEPFMGSKAIVVGVAAAILTTGVASAAGIIYWVSKLLAKRNLSNDLGLDDEVEPAGMPIAEREVAQAINDQWYA